MKGSVPELRVTRLNHHKICPDGDFVLYWMVAYRRPTFNFSLQRAVDWCQDLGKPLLILEALRSGYQWSSPRLHRFILDGLSANQRFFENRPATYFPYVETEKDTGKGLLSALAKHACVLVTDDFPCFFLPRMVKSAGERLKIRAEKVDSNGVLPMRAADKVFLRAFDFRRFLQQNLRDHLADSPLEDPLAALKSERTARIPDGCRERWPPAEGDILDRGGSGWKKIPLREDVPVTEDLGGFEEATARLDRFLESRLAAYAEDRNQPEAKATSELSPWLHFGHISSHQILRRVLEAEGTQPLSLRPKKLGKAGSWWEIGESAQAFLDQVLTWRELGFNMCWQRSDYMEYESLPDWARQTLAEHARDPRGEQYSLEEFEAAKTHDELWNAAQRQLLREGRIHNYLRMVWGKKILEWSSSPQEAARIMIHLNDKYALDGRDPNSYSGIFWCLGRYDRAWGPERPIFGKIRYMTTENTARKYRVQGYLQAYSSRSD